MLVTVGVPVTNTASHFVILLRIYAYCCRAVYDL